MKISNEDEMLFIQFLECTANEYVELRTYANTLSPPKSTEFRKHFVEKRSSGNDDDIIEKLSKLKIGSSSATIEKTKSVSNDNGVCNFIAWKGQKREKRCNHPSVSNGKCKNHLRK